MRFALGFSPLRWALRACIMNTPQPAADTWSTNECRSSIESISSTPILVFTVTGMAAAARIAWTQSATSWGVRNRHAPKLALRTLELGQPTLMFISSKPSCSARTAQAASAAGSLPPTCNASGCSLRSNSRPLPPCRMEPLLCISVYSSVCLVMRRISQRKWRWVVRIIGATDNRLSRSGGITAATFMSRRRSWQQH